MGCGHHLALCPAEKGQIPQDEGGHNDNNSYHVPGLEMIDTVLYVNYLTSFSSQSQKKDSIISIPALLIPILLMRRLRFREVR